MNNNIIIKKYKCFQDETIIEKPSLVNLIIGRNNCGKTSFTEIIEHVYADDPKKYLDGIIDIEFTLNDSVIRQAFSSSESRGFGFGSNYTQYDYGKALIGKTLIFKARPRDGQLRMADLDFEQPTIKEKPDKTHYSNNDWNRLANLCFQSIVRKSFYRVSAERDILDEESVFDEVDSNGNGATSVIDSYLNEDGSDYNLISSELLDDLNAIMEGENHYSSIVTVKNKGSSKKSICLFENGRRIKLKEMGSGLKTIILVLLIFKLHKKELKNCVLVFEELENNLHPEIQRRLFNYIYDCCKSNQCYAFITSHSHVAINCFYNKDEASIFHVYKKSNGTSTIEKIESFIDRALILDDLGVKASDIFQSNGIIWVEGPSDRIYINKWISLIDSSIKENIDYCFLYYGGKILSHYTASDLEGLIRILLINRNAAIIMDSDIGNEDEPLRDTRIRVKKEFEDNNMFIWVTKGREIENYIFYEDLNRIYGEGKYKKVPQFERFATVIKEDNPYFESQKVSFARAICMSQESLNVLDLEDRIESLVKEIKKWNKRKD